MNHFILCVDVEQFHHTEYAKRYGNSIDKDIVNELLELINLFEKSDVKATFFVVGEWALNHASLVRYIHDCGHEIASHSMRHESYSRMDVTRMKKDIGHSIAVLNDITQENISGFRAPSWQVHTDTEAFYRSLGHCGITYSSSVLPWKGMFGIEGNAGFGNALKKIHGILEIPTSVICFGHFSLPFSLSTFLRNMPVKLTELCVKSYQISENLPVIFNIHPWDIQTSKSPRGRLGLFDFMTHAGTHRFKDKLMQLVENKRFTSFKSYLNMYPVGYP